MSRRKDRERAEAGLIFRGGRLVSASKWEHQRQSVMADLQAAAEKGMKELQGAFAHIARAGRTRLPVSYLRDLARVAGKHGG